MEPRPKKTVDDLVDHLREQKKPEASPEAEIVVEDVDESAAQAAEGDPDASIDDVVESDGSRPWPDWCPVPQGLKLPGDCPVIAVRFRAAWTRRPKGGDRVAILWDLTEADEKIALDRTRGKTNRTLDEMTKQMIRAIDGSKIDWAHSVPHNPSTFYTDIGAKCREALKLVYIQRHRMTTAEQISFFGECIVAGRPAG